MAVMHITPVMPSVAGSWNIVACMRHKLNSWSPYTFAQTRVRVSAAKIGLIITNCSAPRLHAFTYPPSTANGGKQQVP